jgi:nitrogen fixation/metabolism regulation signal transduction histidine kinase
MKYIIIVSACLGAVLLYLLSHASANTAVSEYSYQVLLALNISLAVLFLVLIGLQLRQLYKLRKAQVMGSRLTLRLLGAFALMAIIPGAVVYAVSVNFLTRSIESWFNVKVEAALEGGLRLGQNALDTMLADLEGKGESMSLVLAFMPASEHVHALNELREKNGVQEAVLLTMQGRILAFSSGDPSSSFLPNLPGITQLQQARQHLHGTIEPIPDKGMYLRVLAPVSMVDLSGETRILQLMQRVPKTLSTTAESVQTVYQEYEGLSLSRKSMKDVFALSLTLVLMLAMLSAIAIAFVLSRRLSAPLSILAEGTRAIARGDYSTMLPAHGKDELGTLVQSFNSMTRQLGDATQAAERNRARVEAARGYLETILAHLSSGVLALNENGQLRTYNLAAEQILGVTLAQIVNQPFDTISQKNPAIAPFVQMVLLHLSQEETVKSSEKIDEWQQQIEIQSVKGKQVLLVRSTRLPEGVDRGFVVVFDDITALAQAQRDAAWGEVARRLAHEIKNPLTPIQLSAERLEHKLTAKLDTKDAEVLKRATNTIVSQVSALKTMVNEFSEYARAPVLNLTSINLNRLIEDILVLYEPAGVTLKTSLDANTPIVIGDATMLRQVLHNLLQNAQDALEGRPDPEILISTKTMETKLLLSVTDNGSAFPAEILAHAFEPYMTTKRHGTGLGLAIVKKIVEEHKGHIKIENLEQGGACVYVTLPIVVNPAVVNPEVEM